MYRQGKRDGGPGRRGMIAVQVTLCLIPLCMAAAFAVDLGLMLEYRRRVQAASDAAALAAACDLYANYRANAGLDPKGTAIVAARSNATANGFSANTTVTVNIPPTSGPHSGYPGYAEVILQFDMPPAGFSAVIGSAPLPLVSRSVARGLWQPFQNGILLLDPNGSGALTDSGNGTITVNGASIVIDSSSSQAAILSGNANVTAPAINITGSPGDVTTGNSKFIGALSSGDIPTVNPLLHLPPPSIGSLPTASPSAYKLTGNKTATLNPGVYNGGISLSGNSSATLNPGIYYLAGGGLSLSGGSAISGSGVTIYSEGAGAIDLSGGGSVSLSPPTSGIYKGITIFQDPSSATPLTISGNGGMNLTGTIYAPRARLTVSGLGSSNTVGGQYIVYDLTVSGNGSIDVVWTAASTANVRSIGLVE